MKTEILSVANMPGLDLGSFDEQFTMHWLWKAPDKANNPSSAAFWRSLFDFFPSPGAAVVGSIQTTSNGFVGVDAMGGSHPTVGAPPLGSPRCMGPPKRICHICSRPCPLRRGSKAGPSLPPASSLLGRLCDLSSERRVLTC